MASANQSTLKYSTGFNLPFSGDELLQNFSFINLKNGSTSITATKPDFNGGGGGATSLNVAGVKIFNSGYQNQGNATVSYQGNGTKFFSTPTADSSQTVAVNTSGGSAHLLTTQKSATSNQTLTNKLSGLTTTQWVLIAGGLAGAILLFTLLRK